MKQSATSGDNLCNTAYHHILDEIRTGQIKPGERIRERNIAKELGCSHLPVREAISKLVHAGWLEHKPKSGVKLRILNKTLIKGLWDFREILEVGALDLIFELKDPPQLARLEKILVRFNATFKARDANQYMICDEEFHLALVALSQNEQLIRAHEMVFSQAINAFPGFMTGAISITMSNSNDSLDALEPFSHEEIIRNIRKREKALAKANLRGHIKRGARYFDV